MTTLSPHNSNTDHSKQGEFQIPERSFETARHALTFLEMGIKDCIFNSSQDPDPPPPVRELSGGSCAFWGGSVRSGRARQCSTSSQASSLLPSDTHIHRAQVGSSAQAHGAFGGKEAGEALQCLLSPVQGASTTMGEKPTSTERVGPP